MEMDPPSPATGTTTASSSICTVHPDIIESHILRRLGASTLATASCVSSQLNSLASDTTLWTNICNSTWPSTTTPRISHLLSTFPKGPRSFFSDCFTNPDITTSSSPINFDSPSRLISAVDIFYQGRPMFSKVVETEPLNFTTSPFRIDLLDPKESVPTRIPYPVDEQMMNDSGERFTLSWILIDPIRKRAMNLSSYKPVVVERRWSSSEEVHMRYGWVFRDARTENEGSATEYVKFGISITWDGCQSGEMHVSNVSLDLEDSFGNQLYGKDCLVIIQNGMAGERRKVKGREEEGKRRYEEYMEIKRERILSEVINQRPARLDMLSLAFRVFIVAVLGLLILRRFV